MVDAVTDTIRTYIKSFANMTNIVFIVYLVQGQFDDAPIFSARENHVFVCLRMKSMNILKQIHTGITKVLYLPIDDAAASATVDDVVPVGSGSSSNLACSGLVRVGGAGAFRAFDRRLRNKSGPIPPFF